MQVPAIRRRGLRCDMSQGKLPVVWLHSPGRTAALILHTAPRHGVRVEQVAVIGVDVPEGRLRRSPWRGLRYCVRDIPPERQGEVVDLFRLLGTSGSPPGLRVRASGKGRDAQP